MKVLVLYTGGTIGMSVDPKHPEDGLVPIKGKLEAYCKSNPTMNDRTFRGGKTATAGSTKKSIMVLPQHETKLKRVSYVIEEYENLIDSSNITPEHWKKIVEDIKTNYNDFDGFVVIHGTDTMAYTASALSFMFENLSKCVVITGSQKPIFDTGSDGKINLVTAILIAGNFNIPEVAIFFRDRLIRGNRSIKRAADSFYGFDSLNVPPLLLAGVQLIENQTMVRRNSNCCLAVHTRLNPNVTVLRVHPSLPLHVVTSIFSPPTEGVVLNTYGAGNIPSARKDLTEAIKAATDRGVVVVNCTQCPTGSVEPIYETGKVLEKLGVIFGADMTVEAALAKLMYILSKKKLSADQRKDMMRKSIRGELTETA